MVSFWAISEISNYGLFVTVAGYFKLPLDRQGLFCSFCGSRQQTVGRFETKVSEPWNQPSPKAVAVKKEGHPPPSNAVAECVD